MEQTTYIYKGLASGLPYMVTVEKVVKEVENDKVVVIQLEGTKQKLMARLSELKEVK